jgi:hypothetical protein
MKKSGPVPEVPSQTNFGAVFIDTCHEHLAYCKVRTHIASTFGTFPKVKSAVELGSATQERSDCLSANRSHAVAILNPGERQVHVQNFRGGLPSVAVLFGRAGRNWTLLMLTNGRCSPTPFWTSFNRQMLRPGAALLSMTGGPGATLRSAALGIKSSLHYRCSDEYSLQAPVQSRLKSEMPAYDPLFSMSRPRGKWATQARDRMRFPVSIVSVLRRCIPRLRSASNDNLNVVGY